MLNTDINVQTNSFDGPLALLLHLIQKEEMDIQDLDLVKITSQYLQYLSYMKELNFDVAGDYLYLAATLIFLKSKNAVTLEEENELRKLAPDQGTQILSQEDLIRRLEELQHFQRMAKILWALPKKGHEIFVKPKVNRKTIIDSILTPIELEKLTEVMIDFLFRENRKYTVVKRDRLTIKEKLSYLKNNLEVGQSLNLRSLINTEKEGISEVVITFISLLELARLKKIEISQENKDEDVQVLVVKELDDLDIDQANGFDEEGAEENTHDDVDGKSEEEIVAVPPQTVGTQESPVVLQ